MNDDVVLRIAIDPGANGAIAWEYKGEVSVQKMPDTPTGILECLKYVHDIGKIKAECQVERVGGYMPGNSGPAAVTFARHCGHIDMALIALGIPTLTPVSPQVWQKAVCGSLPKAHPKAGERAKAHVKQERKNVIKDLMQRRYPHLKVTLVTADALGILTYMLEHRP